MKCQVKVALRKESVDRNLSMSLKILILPGVALRKESVDRNKYVVQCRKVCNVALRKESVDRNDNGNPVAVSDLESLSARRAWIEISV